MDALLGLLDQADRLFDAEQSFQGEELRRPGQRAAAVASAGAGAAEVGFDDHHVEIGVLLLEHDRRPQAGVAAADDAHVGAGVLLQRGGPVAVVLEGLVEPEGSHGVFSVGVQWARGALSARVQARRGVRCR
ncbi:hypothetical protein D9M71_495550 [compost metagenome]